MIESLFHREWMSILYECVYAKFHLIDLIINHDMTKKQLFFGKYYTTLRLRER